MDLLPLTLLMLAIYVVGRLIQMAVDPRARQNGPAARPRAASRDAVAAADLH